MTPASLIAKRRTNARNERAASQERFLDLYALLDEPTPNSDPTGAAYALEKGTANASGGEGWADVRRRGRFAWEYKGKHKGLDGAHRQLLRYAGAAGEPAAAGHVRLRAHRQRHQLNQRRVRAA